MSLIPFVSDPFMTDIDRQFNRMLNSMMPMMGNMMMPTTGMGTTKGAGTMTTTGGGTMSLPMDIIETPTAYELHADTPGMTPEDVKVELHEGVLTVSGNRKITRDEKDPSGKVWRSERSAFSFARSFTLPENCKGDDICACMEHGVLKVCIPKKETEPKAEPKRITVSGA